MVGDHLNAINDTVNIKQLEETLFAFRTLAIEVRGEVIEEVRNLSSILGEDVEGPAIVLVDFGAVKDRLKVQVGFPVGSPDVGVDVGVKKLEPVQVLTVDHEGPYDNIRDTYLRLYAVMRERGLLPAPTAMEVLHRIDDERPEDSLFEIQWPLHDWTGLLADGIEDVLGPEARDHVMEGADALTPETPRDERLEWVRAALLRLDGIANEEQRYWAVSVCADCYPTWRIEELRQVYLDTGSVDEVMEAMKGDAEWYSTPYREGNLIYHTKVPYDREAWESATDPAKKRRAYCHCALVQDRIDEVPPTYCYCGTGWVRQVWEGVLERPIRVEVLKSLPAGDDECQFLIHLQEDVVG